MLQTSEEANDAPSSSCFRLAMIKELQLATVAVRLERLITLFSNSYYDGISGVVVNSPNWSRRFNLVVANEDSGVRGSQR